MDRVFPGRVAEMRSPTEQELKATLVMSMEIDEASAKIRADTAHDEPEDESAAIWAGVVPIIQVTGAPEPQPGLDPAIPPAAGIRVYRAGTRFDIALCSTAGGGEPGE